MPIVNTSVPVIWTVPLPPAPAQETVINGDVSPTIDTTIQSQPYNFLLGTTAADGTNTVVDEGAAAVAPVTDGEPEFSSAGVPVDLGAAGAEDPADLDPAVFEAWTSEQQSEYLNYWIAQDQNGDANIADYNAANGTTYTSWAQVVANIGTDSGSTTAPITAILSATTAGTVYILNTLEATDFDSMSLADQEAIAGTAYFQNTLAATLDLQVNTDNVTLPATAPSTLASQAVAGIQAEIDAIEGTAATTTTTSTPLVTYTGPMPPVTPPASVTNADGSVTTSTLVFNAAANDGAGQYIITSTTTSLDGAVSTTTTDFDYGTGFLPNNVSNSTTTVNTPAQVIIQTPTGPQTISNMPAADKAAFIGELQLLQTQLSNQAIVSDSQISTDVQAITARFDRAAAFWTQVTPTTTTGSNGLTSGIVSEDGNASITSTYQTLITQEQQTLAVEQNNYNVANSGLIGGVQPDAPTLIAYFQMGTDSSEGSLITADTAELQAINAELQTYSDMQNLLNTTLQQFGSSSTSTSTETLAGATSLSALTTAQQTLAQMFDSTTGTTPSPLDLLLGIARPTLNMVGATATAALPAYTQTQWNSFGTQLSDAVTQLQQQSQMLTDQIDEETKEQDNEFALGNTALSTMSNMIDQIGRNCGMKIRSLDIGVDSITRWQAEDEIHLPKDGGRAPTFLPLYRPLDEILRRPSLDERLPELMQPENLDPDLLQPAALTAAREGARMMFAAAAEAETAGGRDLFDAAASYLDQDIELDDDVRTALAALLQG